jgi:site-specific DNA-methyltransferase (cytosine-N4-specific)
MESNASALPEREAAFCESLASDLGSNDGFRRQAVPSLLYRYFVAMQDSLSAVLGRMKPGAPYALIVGHNHTVLSGKRRDIDTPSHLASLASHVGWDVEEMVPLQTYKRFGLHSSNAVAAETLVLLRKGVD